jgi:hypothetical protein
LRRTSKYASFLRISGALHLDIFDQPEKVSAFSKVLIIRLRLRLGLRMK